MTEANDAMDKELREALTYEWDTDDMDAVRRTMATLVSQLSVWRSRANYFRGKAEGMAETVAYLKERVKTLEGRGEQP